MKRASLNLYGDYRLVIKKVNPKQHPYDLRLQRTLEYFDTRWKLYVAHRVHLCSCLSMGREIGLYKPVLPPYHRTTPDDQPIALILETIYWPSSET